jgi:HK97 family phage prohead protease
MNPDFVVVGGLSIGYQVVQAVAGKGARLLREIKLAEVSLVTFPMNPAAVVTAVKEQECRRQAAA